VADIAEIAGAALGAGAEAVTLVNTVLAMAIDVESRRPVLGSGPAGGGLSGPAIHRVAVRAVFDVRAAYPDAAIIGVGGVMCGEDAVELMMAGADAVQVGTATFRDPRAPIKVVRELESWCSRRGIRKVSELRGAAHG
jgi:dihydroorotate dehydrogenase (NAD+) catalytic subunit